MSDLDILVKKKDLTIAKKIMSHLDYISETEGVLGGRTGEEHHHVPVYIHTEKNIVVEIHWNISENSFGIDMEPWWERASPVQLNACIAHVPSPEDMIIHLCIHLYNHGYENNILLRSLCDINETLRMYKDEIKWDLLQDIINEHGIRKQVISILYLMREFYDFDGESLGWIEHYDFDFDFLTILKKRVFLTKDNLYAEISPKLLKFMKVSTFTQKTKLLFQKIFPSRDVISKTYSIPTNQKKIYLYHVFHPVLLLAKHSKYIYSVYRMKN
jgi:hypothetical protein